MLGSWLNPHERLRRNLYTAIVAGAALLCAALLAASPVHADVATQVTGNGLNTTVTGTATGVEITGGSRGGGGSGANLFHSFGTFNVGSGDTANFVNDSGLPTTNIIGRVTDARSDIFGTIQTTGFGAANLWLLNPLGFVFGPDAKLDVGGSFHASTADNLSFSNGDMFVVDSAAPVLSVADPSAFGFLGPSTGRIDVLTGTADETTDPVTIKTLLSVPEGKTLSLVGGEVNIGGEVDLNSDGAPDVNGTGYLLAPGGRVNLVSVASAGEATFDPALINGSGSGPITGDPHSRDIDVSGFSQLGNINITQGSLVDAKEVYIRGGQLTIETAAVYPGVFWLYDNLGVLTVSGLAAPLSPPDGGLVDVNIDGDVSIRGSDPVPVVDDLSGIITFAGTFFDFVPGDVPDILVNAHSLSLSGETADIQSVRLGPGNAADVTITADSVEIESGAAVEVLNSVQGPGGSLTVNTGDLVIDGSGSSDFTGFSAQGLFHPGYLAFSVDPVLYFADAGTITVNASNNVTLRNSGLISVSSFAFGSGGGVIINTKNLSLDNGSFITAESTLGGPAGNAEINVSGQINLANNSQISSTTTGSGTGGNVVVTAGQSTMLSNTSGVFASTVPPSQELLDFFASNFGATWEELQAFISDATGIPDPNIFDVLRSLRDDFGVLDIPDSMLIPGNGGAISMTTPLLTVNSEAAVSSSTGWDGNAGEVAGNVGSLVVESGGEIRSRSGLFDPDTGEIFGVGIGNAGSLTLNAQDSITISGGSISTTTIGSGDGGNIELTAGNNVAISNDGSVTSESSDSSDAAGVAGTITISSGNKINLDNGTISTRTASAEGGNIELTASKWVYLLDSNITTSVQTSVGNGGNITIDPEFVILNHSNILANAFEGHGGDIDIVADNIFRSTDSRIDASSALGIDGTVNQSSPDQDVAKELAVLPENFLDVSGLINDRCGARAGASSLVPVGPGGLTVDPDGYLPSFGTMNDAVYHGTGKSSAIHGGQPLWALDVGTSALQLARFTCVR